MPSLEDLSPNVSRLLKSGETLKIKRAHAQARMFLVSGTTAKSTDVYLYEWREDPPLMRQESEAMSRCHITLRGLKPLLKKIES